MPRDRDANAVCMGKVALTHAQTKEILRRSTVLDKKRSAYHCPVCRHWHIGRHVTSRFARREPRASGDDWPDEGYEE